MEEIMGRPTNAERGVESKTERIRVQVSPSERDLIRRAAEKAGLAEAAYARTRLLKMAREELGDE